MRNKARKHIWPVSLAMSLALVGVLAVVALALAGSNTAQAHGPCILGDGSGDTLSFPDFVECVATEGDEEHSHDNGDDNGDGNGDGSNGMTGAAMHASMPDFQLMVLDNGARLDWDVPSKHYNAMITGYMIDRDAYHMDSGNPINMSGDITIPVEDSPTFYRDLGLAYGTTFTYKVQAVVQYDVEGWWNMLDCMEMNDAVNPRSGEPTVGANTEGTTYCRMYDGLSDGAMPVVQRAYAALDSMAYTYYGEWSALRSVTTADSGGRLEPLLDPPTMVRMLSANPACAERITVSWNAPIDFGTVPELDENGVYVGPDYLGGNRAGKEEVGEPATSVTYEVQRRVNNGLWVDVTSVSSPYTHTDVAYNNTYEYRVRAVNSVLRPGPWSMVMVNLTEPDAPQIPRSLNVDPIAANTVELEWLAPIDTTDPLLWRTQADFDLPTDASSNLQYVIERQVSASGRWDKIETLHHQYGESLRDHRTQGYTDSTAPAGNVNYRVAALVNNCNPSAYSQKDEIVVTAAALTLGSPGAVTATSGAAGAITVSYTTGVNATGHLIILAQGSTLVDFDVSIAGSDASFSNVAAGDYTVIVVSFWRMGGTLEFEHSRSTVTVN